VFDMLTPHKINELVKIISIKHTEPRYGMYPPQKKIMDYISRKISTIAGGSVDEISKVKEMTDLLEGFIRYLNDTNKILRLDINKVLTYIYYPETEETTLRNKDNLNIGSKGETVRLWHDAYYSTNRKQIINRLIECKNVLYDKNNTSEYMKVGSGGMPEQMQKRYEEMLLGDDRK
jgi:hypothetical protein